MSHYQQTLSKLHPEHDPRHIEAYMRLEYGTLDGLDPMRFKQVANECALVVAHDSDEAELLAQSYCL